VQEPDKSTFINSSGEAKQNSLSHLPLLEYWREIITGNTGKYWVLCYFTGHSFFCNFFF